MMLESRAHIQHYDEANTTTIHYWAYPDRVVPCTSGQGTCEYLDAVYWMHTTSMLYTFIMWAVLGGVLAIAAYLRWARYSSHNSAIQTPLHRSVDALSSLMNRHLLHEIPFRRLFGRTTMIQVTILLVLSAYLLIFSLIGIVYRTWVTPVKAYPGVYNTRTGLGGFADRVGAMAYALTPLTVLLSTRESLLSLITGLPYHHFNFLHRWTGRIIFLQSFLHTLGWTIVEGNLYRPQPSIYKSFIQEQYIIFGIVAQIFITFLYIFSTNWAIKWTGYEFFKRSHYAIAILYLGACWGHWDGLACWMIASIILIALDKFIRIIRTAFLHVGYRKEKPGLGFRCAQASLRYFASGPNGEDEVVRIEFNWEHCAWTPGQHFYLCFPELSLWQSHPFTPCSLPDGREKTQKHVYLVRVASGITTRLAALAKSGNGNSSDGQEMTVMTNVILCGPYGRFTSAVTKSSNMLLLAGGTGVTHVLPMAYDALGAAAHAEKIRAIDLVWIVRHAADLQWLASEISDLRAQLSDNKSNALRIRIFVTREAGTSGSAVLDSTSSSESLSPIAKHISSEKIKEAAHTFSQDNSPTPTSGFEITYLANAPATHPSITALVADFADRAEDSGLQSNLVIGAGPASIGSELRSAVAEKCCARAAWLGQKMEDEEKIGARGGDGIWSLEWEGRS